MKRLLLILTEFPPSIGGMQTHAAYLSRHLADSGCQLEVFTYRVSDPVMQAEAQEYDAAQAFPIHRVLGRLSYQHNLSVLAAHAERMRPDAIYASTVFYGQLQAMTGIPVICRSVGNDVMRPWLGHPYRWGSAALNHAAVERLLRYWLEGHHYPDWVEALFRRTRERLAAQSARAATLILANSDFTAGLLAELRVQQARIRTVVGGVDSRRFAGQPDRLQARRELALPETGFLLMTACRLVAKKGIDLLLQALPLLRSHVPQAHLVIVGDGPHRQRLQRQCEQEQIEGVIFVGRVAHTSIHRYYAACDLFVLASRESVNPVTGSRDVETMGRVLCEANAAGIPVVAADSGGIPSVIADGVNGLLFKPECAEQLVQQVLRLHRDPELRQRLVQGGLQRARDEFDWHHVLEAHRSAFGSAVGVHA